MRIETESTDATGEYAAAYAAHYTGRELPVALRLYMNVMESHPSTQEAGYSRTQIQNIINAVVPKQELLDSQMDLLRAHFDHNGTT